MAKVLRNVLGGLLLVPVVGCGSVQYVEMPDQSVEVENPQYGRIYVLRPPIFFGSGAALRVYEEGKEMGYTRGGAFMCWERPPGRVTLMTQGENSPEDRSVELEVVQGQRHYLMQRIAMGFMQPNAWLEVQTPEKGAEILATCNPVTVQVR